MPLSELTIVLLVLGLYIPTLVLVMIKLKPSKSGRNKVENAASSSVSELYEVSNKQTKDILKVKDNLIRSLQQKLHLLRDEEDQEQQAGTAIQWDDVKALAKAKGINPLLLEIPFVKKQAKSFIKDMTMEDLIANVDEFQKLAGSKGLKFGDQKGDKSKDAVDELFKQNPSAFA